MPALPTVVARDIMTDPAVPLPLICLILGSVLCVVVFGTMNSTGGCESDDQPDSTFCLCCKFC
jgi:hypothetical protein